jgi:hypothetical protein
MTGGIWAMGRKILSREGVINTTADIKVSATLKKKTCALVSVSRRDKSNARAHPHP